MRRAMLICLCFLLVQGVAWAQFVADRVDYSLDQGGSGVPGEAATALRVGPFALNLPGKWNLVVMDPKSVGGLIVGQGPNGEQARFIFFLLGPNASAEQKEPFLKSLLSTSSRIAREDAEKFGTIVRPLREATSAEGNLLLSAAAEKSTLFARRYRVEYALASRTLGAMVNIVIEGNGRAPDVLESFDRIVNTHKWGWSLYPEQANVFTEPPFNPFDRPDLNSIVRPASPRQVREAWAPEFASLPRLGVVLILVMNKTRETPISVSRQTVRLTLPDGQILKPLEPSEMIKWFDEVYGSMPGRTAKDAIFGNQIEEDRLAYEKGILGVFKGKPRGTVLSFRFPPGIPSGQFAVEYVLDLGADGQIPVKQRVPLNLRP